MKAARVLRFGSPSVITIDQLPRPEPVPGSCWSELERQEWAIGTHSSARERLWLHQPLPVILGSELSGTVEAIGAEVSGFKTGERYTVQRTSNSLGPTRN